MRTTIRNALLVAVAAAALLGPAPAQADPSDLFAAELTNSTDQLAAMTATMDPNVTCDVQAGGRDLVQHTNFVVGEIYAQDFGFGQGECASLDRGRTYSVRIRVQLEYFIATGLTTGAWLAIPGCWAEHSATSAEGVAAPVPPVTTCMYPGPSGYLNRYHRAHAILTTSIPGTTPRHAYSPIWFMAP